MTNPNQIPTYRTPLVTKGEITNSWYSFFSGMFSGQPGSSAAAITLDPTPSVFIADRAGTLWLSGGTTTSVMISRDGQTFYPSGQTSGSIPLRQGDQAKIAYSVGPPTVTWFPA